MNHQTSKAKYELVPIEKIKPDPEQPRKKFNEPEIESMAISIKNEGIINAIEVDSNFMIVTGEQRWRASKIAGLKEVPIKILENLTPNDRFIRQVQENIHQNTMSAHDTIMALDKIRNILSSLPGRLDRDDKHSSDYHKKMINEIHELLGMDYDTVAELLELLEFKEKKTQDALKDKGFARTKLRSIKRVPDKYKKDLENIIVDQKDMTRDTVDHITKAINRADRYGEEDKAKKLLKTDFTGMDTLTALNKINKIVPDEESRTKEPADALKAFTEKRIEMMEFLDSHPLESFDPFHRSLVIRDMMSLGSYLQAYLQSGPEETKKLN